MIQINTAFDEKRREWILGDLGFDKHDAEAANKYFKMVITKVGLVEKAELNEKNSSKRHSPAKRSKTKLVSAMQ